jgi:hypothetical protein
VIAAGALEAVSGLSVVRGFTTLAISAVGDHETARRRVRAVLEDPDAGLRGPDGLMATALCTVTWAATESEMRSAAEPLRRLLEPFRPYVITGPPSISTAPLPAWLIGRLDLLAGRPADAVRELQAAIGRMDELGIVWQSAWARTDLALAQLRCGEPAAARAALAEAEALAEPLSLTAATSAAARVRAELEGREPPPRAPWSTARTRVLRDLTARTGRRTLGAMLRGFDDEQLEQRFKEPRRQRALLRAMARAFQPALAGRLHVVVAYELEPLAIDPPPDSPWRWAMELDAPAGHARLLEPAPLDATTTIQIGLADWVRTLAGLQSAVETMHSGRCSVEGDVAVAARLETMFGAR